MYDVDGSISVCFLAGDWNIYTYSQICSMISRVYKTPMFTSSATKCFKMKYYPKVAVILNIW
jgi:hypothetical protein